MVTSFHLLGPLGSCSAPVFGAPLAARDRHDRSARGVAIPDGDPVSEDLRPTQGRVPPRREDRAAQTGTDRLRLLRMRLLGSLTQRRRCRGYEPAITSPMMASLVMISLLLFHSLTSLPE